MSEKLTDERLKEIRGRLNAYHVAREDHQKGDLKYEAYRLKHSIWSKHARQDIPDLLTEIDRLRVELGDAEDMISALRNDWVVENQHFYDEECVEGWVWIDPQGKEHSELGDHGATPIWPESARAALGRR